MKIAIATEEKRVSAHFGRCGEFTIVEIDGGRIVNQEIVHNPGHECGTIPALLAEKGVKVIVAGGMGAGAIQKFALAGIRPILGVQGDVAPVIDEVIKGTIKEGESLCQGEGHGHGENHQCQHGH